MSMKMTSTQRRSGIKSAVNKSKTKIYIIQQIDRKIDLGKSQTTRVLSYSELIDEIENICFAGTKLNLDYYVDNMLDPDKQDEVFEYFMTSTSDEITKRWSPRPEDITTKRIYDSCASNFYRTTAINFLITLSRMKGSLK